MQCIIETLVRCWSSSAVAILDCQLWLSNARLSDWVMHVGLSPWPAQVLSAGCTAKPRITAMPAAAVPKNLGAGIAQSCSGRPATGRLSSAVRDAGGSLCPPPLTGRQLAAWEATAGADLALLEANDKLEMWPIAWPKPASDDVIEAWGRRKRPARIQPEGGPSFCRS